MSKQIKDRKTFLLKFSVLCSLMLAEMDNNETTSSEAQQLKELLEKHLEMAYRSDIIRSTNFLQTLENKFDTVVRKTIQEFGLKL